MKIAMINMVSFGSTGKIMLQIAETARRRGHEVRTYATVPFDKTRKTNPLIPEECFRWGTDRENMFHYYLGSAMGLNGCFSHAGTKKLLDDIADFQPDVIHLHNLHKFCINLPMLFRFIKKHRIRVVWTLHDCWPFTGQCPHFEQIGCKKWETGCHHCEKINSYPQSRIDNSKRMYKLKKEWFTGVENLTVVTPSVWLADLVQRSFLKGYPVKVINNGIDLSVFRPTPSDFREKNNLKDKYIILGVASTWGQSKGLDAFKKLAESLEDTCQIVLVGTNDMVDDDLPDNIISIHKTNNQSELAELYSTADVFVNPTREDTFPTVNIEALACGTPVVTFSTGGSPECIDNTCGSIVACNDMEMLKSEIRSVTNEKTYTKEACLKRAEKYDSNLKYTEYVELYENM